MNKLPGMKAIWLLPLMAIAALAVAACSSSPVAAPAPSGLTAEELRSALQEAAQSAPTGPSAAEIQALVQQAVEGAVPEGTSASEISAMVSAAVKAASSGGVTASDMQSVVSGAIADAARNAPEPLTAAQVQEIVTAAVDAIEITVPIQEAAAAAPSRVTIDQPQSKNPRGNLVFAVTDVFPGVGLGSSQLADEFHHWGIGESTFMSVEGDGTAPMLATGFTLESDLSGGTLTIRDDVIFHGEGLAWAGGKSWGPMTAADIAYTLNDGNPNLNPRSIHWQAGDFAAMFGSNPFVVIDDTTVGFTFNSIDGEPLFDPRWNANLMNDAGQAFSVQSVAVRDANGDDWMRDNPIITTGPYQIREWKQDDVGVIESVPYDHWRINPQPDLITIREVSEEATKIALLETGEIDAAPVSLTNLPSLIKGGFATGQTGLQLINSVVFSGNLWETTHIITGEPLDTTAVYMRNVPWVGNPADPDDLKQAKLVRNALARAIDRDLINEVFLNGLGSPAHIQVFSTTAPEWQSKWEYEFDPAAAERMLDEAGLPRRGNGMRFEIPLFANADFQGLRREIADAVSGMW
ncbi:MAG: hypothetical protein IIC23_03320, partial [Chloroflexi bacterium]|nr:hypothetical protein [Chloroflexota bacterium]